MALETAKAPNAAPSAAVSTAYKAAAASAISWEVGIVLRPQIAQRPPVDRSVIVCKHGRGKDLATSLMSSTRTEHVSHGLLSFLRGRVIDECYSVLSIRISSLSYGSWANETQNFSCNRRTKGAMAILLDGPIASSIDKHLRLNGENISPPRIETGLTHLPTVLNVTGETSVCDVFRALHEFK